MRKWIKEKARELYARYGTKDPYRIADREGIDVLEFPFTNIEGVIITDGDEQVIGVAEGLHPEEKRRVVAHEISHREISPPQAGYFALRDTLYNLGKDERQADLLAAELLLLHETPGKYESLEEFAERTGVPVELVKLWLGEE